MKEMFSTVVALAVSIIRRSACGGYFNFSKRSLANDKAKRACEKIAGG